MTIEQFAEKYHTRTRRDECGDAYISGTQYEHGHQIYEHGQGRFAVLLMFPVEGHVDGGPGKSARWVHARKKLISAGFTLKRTEMLKESRCSIQRTRRRPSSP